MAMAKNTIDGSEKLLRLNLKLSKRTWGPLPRTTLCRLAELTRAYGFSVASGEIQLLDGNWYITHAGLIDLAATRHYELP